SPRCRCGAVRDATIAPTGLGSRDAISLLDGVWGCASSSTRYSCSSSSRVVFWALRAALIVPAPSPLVGSGSQVPTLTCCQVLGSPARASPLHLGLPGSASLEAAAQCLVFVALVAGPPTLHCVRFVVV